MSDSVKNVLLALAAVATLIGAVAVLRQPPAPPSSAAVLSQPGDSASPSPSPRPVPIAAPQDVLVLGDSITAGRDATSAAATYVGRLKARFSSAQFTVNAIPGGLAQDVFAKPLPARADLVVIELGTNDWNTHPVGAFAAQYVAETRKLRAAYAAATIVCVGPWQPPGSKTSQFDDAVAAGCAAVHGRFLSVTPLFDDPANHAVPGQTNVLHGVTNQFHPSNAGHAALASAVLATLGLV